MAPPRRQDGAPGKARPHPGRGDRTGDLAIAMARRIRDVQVLGWTFRSRCSPWHAARSRPGVGRAHRPRPGDAERLAVADASVDVATVAFGVRNFETRGRLRELARTIKPGAKSLS